MGTTPECARRDADRGRIRGCLDHVKTEGEWWQTDLDCKLQDFGLFVGGVMDVATRYMYTLRVLTFKGAYPVFEFVHKPAVEAFGGLPAVWSTDKGSETWLLAYTIVASDARRAAGTGARARHRFVESKRNVRIERFWGFLNPRAMLPLKRVLLDMIRAQQLDMCDRYHLGAVQAVGAVLLQHGVDIALRIWNQHPVLSLGGKRSLGSPNSMRANAPQLAGKVPMLDGTAAEYDLARGRRLQRWAPWQAARDQLHGRPNDMARRDAAVERALGPLRDAWADVLHNGGVKFREAIAEFLRWS